MKLTEWCDVNNRWHCGDYSDLGNDSNVWYRIPKLLGMSIFDFLNLLTSTNATITHWFREENLLLYHWNNKNDMRKFKNKINKMFREMY